MVPAAPLVVLMLLLLASFTIGEAAGRGPPPADATSDASTPRLVVKSVGTLIPNGARPDFGPPASGKIAFDRKEADTFYDVHTALEDGTGAACLTCNLSGLPNRNMGRPAWHPSGDFVAFMAEKPVHPAGGYPEPSVGTWNDIWALRLSDKTGFQLTNITLGEDLGSAAPRFSADGRKICWSEMTARPNLFVQGQQFGYWKVRVRDFVVESGTPAIKNARDLAPWGPAFFGCTNFSPDGKRILYVSNPLKDRPVWERLALYSHDLSSTDPVKLTPEGFNYFASYTQDGSAVMFVTNRDVTNGGSDYWSIEADGSRASRTTFFNEPSHPHYLGRKYASDQFAFSATNGRALAMVSTSDAPAEEKILDMRFVAVSTLAGKVTDTSAAPLAGAKVEAFFTGNGTSAGFTTSSASGDYLLDLAAGDLRVVGSLSGYDPATETARAEPWKRTTLDFVLQKPGEGTLKGVAKDRDSGTGIGGASVKAVAGALSFTATADAAGSFEMTVKPGAYEVTLTAPGYETSTRAGVKSGPASFSLDAAKIRVKETSIADGATNVPVDPSVTLRFSVAMDRASAESSISIKPGPAVSFAWLDDSTVVVSVKGLESGTPHVLAVAAGAMAKAGGAMSADHLVSFTTAGLGLPGGSAGGIPLLLVLLVLLLVVAAAVGVVLARRRKKRPAEGPAFFPSGAPPAVAEAKPAAAPPSAPPTAKAGVNTLFLGPDANAAFDAVRHLAEGGARVLVLSTSMPAKLKAARRLESAEVLWITEKSGPGKVQATRLEFEVQKAVNEFFLRGPGGVLVIDGVDYLWSRAGGRTVTEFLKRCADTAAEKGGTLIATLDPAAVQDEQVAVLKRAFDRVDEGK
jgi:hypothetical protein